jgi:hypothetical protein
MWYALPRTSNPVPRTPYLALLAVSVSVRCQKESFLPIEPLREYHQLIVRILPWIINNLIEQLS